MEKTLICVVCPRGCTLTVKDDDSSLNVSGNFCIRGKQYAHDELINPKRKVATTMAIKSSKFARLPVTTSQPIAKNLVFKVIEICRTMSINTPVRCGDILVENVLGTNVNIIASRSINE